MLPQLARIVALSVTLAAAASLPGQEAGPPPSLSGRVTDSDGKPVPGATVQYGGPDAAHMRCDAQGRYRFCLREAGDYTIYARAPGFLYGGPSHTFLQLTPESQATYDIALQRGACIVVSVTDSAGRAIKDAFVGAVSPNAQRRYAFESALGTDEEGVATLVVAPSSEPYRLIVHRPGFALAYADVTAESVENPTDVAITLQPGQSASGVALCSDGKPATGWEISAVPEWWAGEVGTGTAQVDAQGSFTLKDLVPGTYRLSAIKPSWKGSGTMEISPAPISLPTTQGPIRLNLLTPSPAGGERLSGKVKLAAGAAEHRAIEVFAISESSPRFRSQVSFPKPAKAGSRDTGVALGREAVEGTYSFDSLRPGKYQLRFQPSFADGRTPMVVPVDDVPFVEPRSIEVTVPGEVPVVDLKLVGRPRLAGAVVDQAGNPLKRYTLHLIRLQDQTPGPQYDDRIRWIVCHPEGAFALTLPAPGAYRLEVAAEGYATNLSQEIRAEDPEAKPYLKVVMTQEARPRL